MIKRRNFSRVIKTFLIAVVLFMLSLVVLFYFTTGVTKNLDAYEYELPFKNGEKHSVAQGYGGLFSHRHIAALDFEMPVGTPVCAAREGVVYSYRDNSDAGGILPVYKDKANYIIIKHDDGSFGCYWHLQKVGVLVKHGRVARGQPIALSGATGQVVRPHLHFSVKKKLNYRMNSFTRTVFKTTKGPILLNNGETYERPAD